MIMFLLACTGGGGYAYSGVPMSDYFPLDGERTWVFNNEDTTITWQLRISKQLQTSQKDGREVVTLDYDNAETGELLGTVSWSVVKGDEVLVHDYSLGAEASVAFDPPVAITTTSDTMQVDEEVASDTKDSNGKSWTFTGTYVESYPECPTTYSDDFTKCAHFVVTTEDGGEGTTPLFVADMTLVSSLGPAFVTLPGWSTPWELSSFDFSAEE
ncbi:MAG: hypothetical protein FJ090_19335 [Deltaproteobacteria bacterium]|nr:hypothetical protein [Deltaproteobacteria bacterium]